MLKIPKQSISFTKSRQNPNPRMKDKLFSLTVRHRRARPWPYSPAQSRRRPPKGPASPPSLFSGACSPLAKGAKARWMATDAGRPGTVAAAAAESAGGDGAAMATWPARRRSSVRRDAIRRGTPRWRHSFSTLGVVVAAAGCCVCEKRRGKERIR